jgi:hypothetical protein
VHHARLCAALAARYLGQLVVPVFPSVRHRPRLSRPAALERLVSESYTDGCIGELAAARVAKCAARRALDPEAHFAQTRIARDERRHAELAYRIVEWALSLRDRGVQSRLCAELERSLLPAPAHEVASAYGRASARERNDSLHWAHARARARVGAMIAAA